ncbi:FHA domain-containing protein [Nocardia sp. 348MFTsu5.1]|uniref:FHA domain-containing protein n=1 Tax=Nocardia sp. 348MFTsu5.1 TaxID=1172185 RepID=UPI00037538F7|nr:FHA domain-containing protein [Nocardia sp. 348MFTsu5.1]
MTVNHPVSVLPGRGIALRRGPSLLLIAADPMKTSATLTDLARIATEPLGESRAEGSRLRSLTKWLLANEDSSPGFAVISTDQHGGLEVFLYGGATARMYVTELASPEVVRGADSGFLVQRSYPSSLYAIAVTIDETDPLAGGPIGAAGIAPSHIFSLEKGAAPGAGMILWPSASPSTDSAVYVIPATSPVVDAADSTPLMVGATGSDAETRLVPPILSVRLDDLDEATQSTRSPLPIVGGPRKPGKLRQGVAEPTLVPPQDVLDDALSSAPTDVANRPVKVGNSRVSARDQKVQIHGLLCANGHINDPRLPVCTRCGIRIDRRTGALVQGPRPPLGLLVIDDGSTYVVAGDLLIGRDPEPMVAGRGGVAAGGIGPLDPIRINDTSGSMSRAHCELRLVDWEVRVIDTGSVNGTYVRYPRAPGWITLRRGQEAVLYPGSQLQVGSRSLLFESPHGRVSDVR